MTHHLLNKLKQVSVEEVNDLSLLNEFSKSTN